MSEYYFSNKKENHGGCGCEVAHSSCGCGFNPTACEYSIDCSKYTEISNKKCEEASEVNAQANQIALQACAMEQEAERLQAAANKAACEAQALWRKYNALSVKSSELLKEAQKSLDEGIKCQKSSMNSSILHDHRPCCSDCKPCCTSCRY